MSKRELQSILRSLRRELARVLGDQLVSMILYGSQARGQARSDSDIDVLVVVRDDSDYDDLIRAALRRPCRPCRSNTTW